MFRAPFRRPLGLASLAAVALLTAGCGGDAGAGSPAGTADSGGLQVVTSTNVYGNIVELIGGDSVEVTAVVDSLSQDPHSYEPTVQDKLAVSKADLVIENGGGYDPFLSRLAEETGLDAGRILSAVEVAGIEGLSHEDHAEEHGDDHAEEHAGEDGAGNEHVWYHLGAMRTLAAAVSSELGALDEAHAAEFEERALTLSQELDAIEEKLGDAVAAGGGGDVAVTEPVPGYLLEAAGLTDVTPAHYAEAIEEGSDVSIGVLNDMKKLVASDTVKFLAYNEQTEGSQTQAVRDAAEKAGVPVVNFTETLPVGEDYVSWMSANADSIVKALNAR